MPVLEFICGWMILLVIFLMGRKTIWGPISGLVTQACWVLYTLLTHQYSLLVPMALLGLVYVWVIFRWSREKTEVEDAEFPRVFACASCKTAVATTLFLGYYRCPACVKFLKSNTWASFLEQLPKEKPPR